MTNEAVVHAVRADEPRDHYVIGEAASFFRFLTWWMPHSWFESLLRSGDDSGEATEEEMQKLFARSTEVVIWSTNISLCN